MADRYVTDEEIITFIKLIREGSRDDERRAMVSLLYETGDLKDLFELDYPNAVQHDYPAEFPDD